MDSFFHSSSAELQKEIAYESPKQPNSQIDLWVVRTVAGSVAYPDRYFNILSNCEKQRYRRFLFESDRQQFLVSRVLLRTVLSHTTGGEVEPYRWRFKKNTYGKPTIDTGAGLPCLHFNLSHCRELAVVAVSLTCPVGVDIEPLNRTIDVNHFDTVLSPRERAWLHSRPLTLRRKDFTRIWTLKEAYAKLLGIGFSLDFGSFEVALEPVRMVRTVSGSQQPDDLYLETRNIGAPEGDYHLSLAALRPLDGGIRATLRTLSDLSAINIHRDDLIGVI